MKKYLKKLKYYWKYDLWSEIRIFAGFPQIWMFVVIIVLALFSFAGSYFIEDAYWSSICSNIFAGFVTGVVLLLLTGIRQIYIAKQEMKLGWLRDIHEQIMKYIELERQLLSGKFSELSLEDYVYDLICEAHNVNTMIAREHREKKLGFNGLKYCKKRYFYDADEKSSRDNKIREKIIDGDYADSKSAALLFADINHDLFELNYDIVSEIRDIEIKLKTISRSII